jgi:AraC-like DNA-binding protein
MEELFHKTAKPDWEEQLRRSGVVSASTFSDHSNLRAFLPDPSLREVISHYWIVRWRIPAGIVYRPVEILSAPTVTLFFTKAESYLYGLTTTTYAYEARGEDTMAGVTFHPGGFHPYWRKRMTMLPPRKVPVAAVLPSVAGCLEATQLADLDEAEIAARLDGALREIKIQPSPHLRLIKNIIAAINAEGGPRTVREVCEGVRVPERTLQHIFKEEVGLSLKWVMMRARLLETITQSFAQGDPDWAAVAYELGYSSQAHFIADFKRAVGLSPGRFHKIQREQRAAVARQK